MAHPPKGMFRRKTYAKAGKSGKLGQSWWMRDQRGDKDRWISLGPDLDLAIIRFHRIRSGDLAPSRVTLKRAIKLWRDSRGKKKRSARYLEDTLARLARYVEPELGARALPTIAPSDLERLAVHLRDDHPQLKPETHRHILSDLRCVLRWAVDEGLLHRSPIPRDLVGKVPPGTPKAMSTEDQNLLRAVGGPHGFLLRVALGTGLAWADLLPRQADELKLMGDTWCFRIARKKTGQPALIPVHPVLAAEIRGHCGRLFPFKSTSTSGFNRVIRRRSGLKDFSVHRTRHSFSTDYRAAGGNGDVLDYIMGHASRSPMRDRYAPLAPETVIADAKRVWVAQAFASSSNGSSNATAEGV